MLAQRSAIQNVADYIFAAGAANPQFDEAVGQQDACARLDFAGEIRKRGGDSRRRAGNVSGSDDDGRAGFDFDGFVALQASSADLGPLQILQNADGAVFFFSGAAQERNFGYNKADCVVSFIAYVNSSLSVDIPLQISVD